jgi:cell division protein ZipA
MMSEPVLAFAWNPAIGIPMLIGGLIVLGLLWLFGQPKKEQGKRRLPADGSGERREPTVGDASLADNPFFSSSGRAEPNLAGPSLAGDPPQPAQGELDMGLRAELEKLGATLAGERTAPNPTVHAHAGTSLPKPTGQAATIVDALRAPSHGEPLSPPAAAQVHAPAAREPVAAPAQPVPPPRSDLGRRPAQLPVERIVTLFLMARDGGFFTGADLVVAAEKAGLEFGDMGIYHRLLDGKRELGPIFSVANMLKPGNFDLSRLDTLRTPGLSFFMTLPGPLSALDAWDAMLPTAQRLAELLDSQVLDEERNALGRQRIAHIRDELRGWDRGHEGKEIIFGH